jgi:hypothetical protein
METKDFFEKEINELLLLTEEELLLILGDDLFGTSTGMFKPPKEQKLLVAKKWLQENKNIIQSKICTSKTLKYYLFDTDKYDKIVTISSILDLILSLEINVSPIVVSILIFKEGFKTFCSDYLTT